MCTKTLMLNWDSSVERRTTNNKNKQANRDRKIRRAERHVWILKEITDTRIEALQSTLCGFSHIPLGRDYSPKLLDPTNTFLPGTDLNFLTCVVAIPVKVPLCAAKVDGLGCTNFAEACAKCGKQIFCKGHMTARQDSNLQMKFFCASC